MTQDHYDVLVGLLEISYYAQVVAFIFFIACLIAGFVIGSVLAIKEEKEAAK